MWFNNAIIFKFEQNEAGDLNEALIEEALKPCPPHARFIYGWVPAFDQEMVHEVAGASLICLGKEERILPRGVINKLLKEKIQQIETQQGRPIKRAEKSQMAEDLEFELLPKSFCVLKKQQAMLDTVSGRLIINSSSANQAAQLTSFLRKTVSGINIEPIALPENLALRFAEWIHSPDTLPAEFQLASDCLLFSLDDEKKRVHCKGYELPAEEILTLLGQGMATAEISLIWKERIQFTLTQDFIFKRLKCLDYLVDEFNESSELEEEYQRRDAALTILSAELRDLSNDLINIFTKEEVESPDQVVPTVEESVV